MKKLFIVSMLAVTGITIVQGAILVGPTGSGIIDFATRPAPAEWSTSSSAGVDTTFGTAAQMDAAVQSAAATNFNMQVFDGGVTNPPAQTQLASWSGGGSAYLQTRPTANAGTALMATLKNDNGIDAASLTITYMLNESGTTPPEQVPGHLVYVSLTGLPNSWMLIPALSGGAIGLKSNTVVLPGGWVSGALLYVLWADDNATGGGDRGYQIDDVAFVASNDAVPLSVTLTAPAPSPLLVAPADVQVAANASGTVPATEVSFYTNDVLFFTDTAPPYSNQLMNLPPGIYSIYAVAVNASETAYSRTNTVKVRDEFVHYFGGTHIEDFDGMGQVNGETPIGWYVGAALPANTMTVTAGDGSAGAATAIHGWNYGMVTEIDRALGTAPTGADRNMVVRIQNNTSSNIVSFEIRYDGEVWRNYTNVVGGWLTNLVSFDLGASWIPTAYDFSQPFAPAEPQGAVDGNAAANRIANIGGVVTPPAPVAPGSVVYIRWHDFNDGGVTDGGLAIDNFNFTATLEQFMSFVTITSPTNEATFPEAAPISINATAAMENPITHVSFFRDGISIGDDTNAPYSAVYSNSTPGIHALTATAYDIQGTSVSVATPIQITVNSNVLPGITITNPPDGSTYFVGVTVFNISASAFDQDGALTRVEFYLDGDLWATDTTSPYSFDLCDITAGAHTIQAVAVDNANGRASHSISIAATNPPGIGIIIANGSTWKYRDDGSDQGSVWRELTFDDSGWSNGAAELGYGDGPGRPERTMVGFGPNPNAKNPTTYFRKIFNVNNPALFSNVILRLLRDDHAIVYLNGNQVFSDVTNTVVDFSTYIQPTSADDGTVYEVTNVPVALLTQGANILAVEVHQDVGTSSDISFDLMLWAQGGQPEPPTTGTQPQSQAVTVGSSATFDVDVSGSPPFSYQWHLNCRDIPEGTNRILTIQGARFEDAGNYSVTIRNAFGQITSWDAALSVSNVVEPLLKINRGGNSNITVRWPRREVPYRLQELSKIEPPTPTQGQSQRWADSDASFELSGQDLLGDVESGDKSKFFRVASPSIRIMTHPEGRSANLDDSVTLSVVATGVPPLSYQWRFNGSPLIGETNPTISILVNRSSYGAYQVAVADAKDALLSRAAVLRPAGLETALSDSFQGSSLFIEPTGSLHGLTFGATKESGEPDHAGLPGGRSVWLAWRAPASGVVTFDTIGSGFDTLLAAYLVGAPGQSSIAADDDAGSNLCSQIRFNVAADNVYNIAIDGLAGAGGFFVLNWSFTQLAQGPSLPIIDLQPVDRIIKSNEITSFTVAAHDLQGSTLNYQWYVNGNPVSANSGGNNPTLQIGGPQPSVPVTIGQYYVDVMNSRFSVRSRFASLQISTDPEFRFVSKLLVDSICGFIPYDPAKSATRCCGASFEDSSKTMPMPKLLSAAAGSLTGSLTYGGTPPPVGSRAYWTWVTNGWDCLKLVTLTANVQVGGTPQSCTLVIIDGATGLLVKPADSGMSPNTSNINKAKAGKVYWIALGFDNPSAVGTLSYSFTGTCP